MRNRQTNGENTTKDTHVLSAMMTRRWLVAVAGVWWVLYLQQQQVSANVSFVPHIRLNKTHLDEINKRAWFTRLIQAINLTNTNASESKDGQHGSGMSNTTGAGSHLTATPDSAAPGNAASLPPLIVSSKSPGKNVLEFELKKKSSSAGIPASAAKVNLYVYVWKRRESRRMRRNRRKSRKRLIKIRVFQADGRNRKGKRIAELRKHVNKSHWHRLPLPVSLIHSMLQAQNGTLKLRIRCKRCNRKLHLIMPTDAIRCSKQKSRRQKLNANRKRGAAKRKQRKMRSSDSDSKCSAVGRGVSGLMPFMVIENKAGGGRLPVGPSRIKRSSNSSSSASSFSPSSSSSSASSVSSVSRVCSQSSRHGSCCVLALPVDPSEYSLGDSIVAPTTLTATSCHGSCSSARPAHRRRRMRGGGRRGGRRRKNRLWTCQPVADEPLDIWYFDHNHELAHASLPGLVISQCGCRRQQRE